jgi:hypothetical protein
VIHRCFIIHTHGGRGEKYVPAITFQQTPTLKATANTVSDAMR